MHLQRTKKKKHNSNEMIHDVSMTILVSHQSLPFKAMVRTHYPYGHKHNGNMTHTKLKLL